MRRRGVLLVAGGLVAVGRACSVATASSSSDSRTTCADRHRSSSSLPRRPGTTARRALVRGTMSRGPPTASTRSERTTRRTCDCGRRFRRLVDRLRGLELHRVPARDRLRAPLLRHQPRPRARRSTRTSGTRRLEPRVRPLHRRLAGAREPRRLRGPDGPRTLQSRRPTRCRAARRARCREREGALAVPRRGDRVLAAARRPDGLLRLLGPPGLRAGHTHRTGRGWTFDTGDEVKGGARATHTEPSTRAPTTAMSTRSTHTRAGPAGPAARSAGCADVAGSMRRPPSRTAASSWARRTGSCTRSARGAVTCSGPGEPGATSTERRPSPAGRSTSARTTTASTRSTRRPERCAGASTPRHPISGAPTVLDGLVYFSTCGSCSATRRTPAPAARSRSTPGTGRLVWTFPDGEYSPLVADSHRAYLTGLTNVYALEPPASSAF